MNRRRQYQKSLRKFWPILLLVTVWMLFFHKTIFLGQIPFPGDLIVSEYKPWSSESYLGYNPGSYPSKAQYFDTARQMYPWKHVVSESLKSGHMPLWNPYNFSGSPLLANNQSQVFYPTTVLLLFLPLAVAWTLGVIIQPLLASIGMYLYSRSISLSKHGSIIAALAFSYGLFFTVFLQYNTILHVIAWLPFSLYAIERLIERRSNSYRLMLFLSLVLSGLAGHLQFSALVFMFTIVYGVIRLKFTDAKNIVRPFVDLCIIALLAIMTCAIQLLPTIELLGYSARVNQTLENILHTLLIQPKQLLMLFVPDIFGNPASRNYMFGDAYPGKAMYIGITSLLFVHLALRYVKSFYVRMYSVLVIIGLVFLSHNPVSAIFYSLELPVVSTSAPNNAIFFLSFALSIIGGFGADWWLKNKKIPLYSIGVFSLIFGALWIFTQFNPVSFHRKPLLLSTIVLAASIGIFTFSKLTGYKKHILFGILALLMVSDLYFYFQKFNPFVPSELVFTESPISTWLQKNSETHRSWGYGTAHIEANFASYYEFYSPDGYDPLYPTWYGSFLHASSDGNLLDEFTGDTRSDARITQGFGDTDFADNTSRKQILNFLGIKYILNRTENGDPTNNFPPDSYPLVHSYNDWQVYENTTALPRVFVAGEYEVYSDDTTFEKLFFDPSAEHTKTALLEDHPSLANMDQSLSSGSAEIITYTPNRVVIDTYSDGPAFLVLTDTYFPGWEARVGETKLPIHKAFYSFRAVPIPGGNQTVTFTYNPDSFSWGLKISMISIGSLCLYLYRKRNEKIA